MYSYWVPVTPVNVFFDISIEKREELMQWLKEAKVDRLMLCANLILDEPIQLAAEAEMIKQSVELCKSFGFKAGVWVVPTLNPSSIYSERVKNFVHQKWVTNRTFSKKRKQYEQNGPFCPLDKRFIKEFSKCVVEYAKSGTDLILFEDDFTVSGRDIRNLCCCCDLHMKEFEARIGAKIKRSELMEKIYGDGRNRYREEWYRLKKDTITDFFKTIRKAVDTVSPSIRLGPAANRNNFEMDAPVQEIAKAAAGNNKPFVRMTVAPYWDEARMPAKIEAVRMQAHWLSKNGIEMLSEGDNCPRLRGYDPANHMECFDMILRADGRVDGCQKYMIMYFTSPFYEQGYMQHHIKNLEAYDKIDEFFGNKNAVGVNIYEKQDLINDRVFDCFEPVEDIAPWLCRDTVIRNSAFFATDNSIPTAYAAEGYAKIVFGENARHICEDELCDGVILDIKAAAILNERGIDVGLESYTECVDNPHYEYFNTEKDYTSIMKVSETHKSKFYRTIVKSKAVISSEFRLPKDNAGEAKPAYVVVASTPDFENFPACYMYENEKGQRFVVYTFVASSVQPRVHSCWFTGLFTPNYYRQKQLIDGIEWAQKKKLPAVCLKNPYLYILCKKGADGLTIGLWNISSDRIFEAKIDLDSDTYTKINFYNGNGKLQNGSVFLEGEIPPYGFVFITVS